MDADKPKASTSQKRLRKSREIPEGKRVRLSTLGNPSDPETEPSTSSSDNRQHEVTPDRQFAKVVRIDVSDDSENSDESAPERAVPIPIVRSYCDDEFRENRYTGVPVYDRIKQKTTHHRVTYLGLPSVMRHREPNKSTMCVFCKETDGCFMSPIVLSDGPYDDLCTFEESSSRLPGIKRPERPNDIDVFHGMKEVVSGVYLLYYHKKCINWYNRNIEHIFWTVARFRCSHCSNNGPPVLCLSGEDCEKSAHVRCAMENGWILDEDDNFHSLCSDHTHLHFYFRDAPRRGSGGQ